MKIIIAGSRTMSFSSYPLIAQSVKRSGFDVTEVGCGMADGADTFGMKWAYEQEPKIPVEKFPADWGHYGRRAGYMRNIIMGNWADGLIVLIWGESKGSMNMLEIMQNLNKPCYVLYDGN